MTPKTVATVVATAAIQPMVSGRDGPGHCCVELKTCARVSLFKLAVDVAGDGSAQDLGNVTLSSRRAGSIVESSCCRGRLDGRSSCEEVFC